MSKFTTFTLALIALINLSFKNLAQNIPSTLYWFETSIEKNTNEETGSTNVKILKIGTSINSGTFQVFINKHTEALNSGKILIGPFDTQKDAYSAQLMYNKSGKYYENAEKEKIAYMFFVKPVVLDQQSETIKFENIPARVSECTENIFPIILGEGLSFERFAIGPFPKYELAEKAKYVFLKNGRIFVDEKADSIKKLKLKSMAKKWKKQKLNVTFKKHTQEIGKAVCRFSTRFKKRYFDTDAVQIIFIYAVYEKSSKPKSHGITLQGNTVMDNNRVIPFNMRTSYAEVMYFDQPKNNKIKGFFVNSFVYNASELIELPSKFVTVK